jgi:hypothetical protein
VVHDDQFLISMNDDEAVAGALWFAFRDWIVAAGHADESVAFFCFLQK